MIVVFPDNLLMISSCSRCSLASNGMHSSSLIRTSSGGHQALGPHRSLDRGSRSVSPFVTVKGDTQEQTNRGSRRIQGHAAKFSCEAANHLSVSRGFAG